MAVKIIIDGQEYLLLPSAFLDRLFGKVFEDLIPLKYWKEEQGRLTEIRGLTKRIIEFSADHGFYPYTDEIPITKEILDWLQKEFNIQYSPF